LLCGVIGAGGGVRICILTRVSAGDRCDPRPVGTFLAPPQYPIYNDDDEYDDDDRTPMKKFVDWLVFGPEDAAENEDDGFREARF